MKRILPAILLLLSLPALSHAADYGLGISFDTSSNMLMRPGGPSGMITNLDGAFGFSRGGFDFSYQLDAGTVQHYDGVQYQRHTVEISRDLLTGDSAERRQVTLKASGGLSRYGEVSFLGGYSDYGFSAAGKSYLGESTLLRGEGSVQNRNYRDFDLENYRQASGWLRLDRFLESGTTLRLQFDGGVRKYPNLPSADVTTLFDIRARVAQSLGPKTGAWLELHNRWAGSRSTPDTSVVYERLLFEDAYKSSSFGGVFHIKRLIADNGSVQFEAGVEKKRFGRNTAAAYWYLPYEGWNELESEFTLSLSWRPGFVPEFIHPSLQLYRISIDSSIEDLSYHINGMILGFMLY